LDVPFARTVIPDRVQRGSEIQ